MKDYLSNRPFLLITNITKHGPPPERKPSLYESVSVVDRVKPKHMQESSVIIDLLKAEVVKSRLPQDNPAVLEYFTKKYAKEIAESFTAWGRRDVRNAELMQTMLEAANVAATKAAETDEKSPGNL